MNRLARERSPYLLQHAHNPVDWFAWGDEAFAKARAEDKPIFLSIGYSTCHWCHVMERESFENGTVATALNEHFVSIKVDREERADALARTVTQFREAFDPRTGGFGSAPKFPRPSELLFLFREHARTGDRDAREMALRTLRAMALGGMRDHIGGGFHRYSVDAEWRVPHFEKMLYDQAQLTLAYLEAAQISGDQFYAEVAEDTLLYVHREMTDEAGGFYSSEDADSLPPEHAEDPNAHKAEGAFYLWRADEIDRLLG